MTLQGWRRHAVHMLLFNAALLGLTYAVLRLQGVLPGNPQGLAGLSPDLAFNTAISFATNTNWQSCGGDGAAFTLVFPPALILREPTTESLA